jgi:hypothetical protein
VSLKKIEGRTVTLENVYSYIDEEIGGIDRIVLSLEKRSNREVYDKLKGTLLGKELYFIGDTVEPGLI